MRALTRVAAAVAAASALLLSGCAQVGGVLGDALGAGSKAEAETGVAHPETLPEQPDGTVESFAGQQPNWIDCGSGMQCADVYAPLDWDDPAGDTITLSLVKHPAANGEPRGSLFVNPGGPGASGIGYVADSLSYAVRPDIVDAYDVIGWDPRGVGASTPVDCLEDAELDDYLYGLGTTEGLETGTDEWIAAATGEATDFAEACEARSGDLLAHVDTESTAHDLDMMRAIVGDAKLNYLGYSYGTYIGARYADAFPDRVGRLVLDGAMDPTATLQDVVREQTRGFELALRAYMTDCLGRGGCPFDGTVDQAMAQIGHLIDRVDADPLTASDGRQLGASTMLTAIITPLYSQGDWGLLDDLFTTVNSGDADFALRLADFYNSRENGRYLDNSTEAFSAINCLDYPQGADADRMRADAAELDRIAPTIGRFQGFGDISCATWPATGVSERKAVTAAGADPILVVGTTGDPATPYRWAESLAEQLESGVLVTYHGEGHTAYGSGDCIDDVVDAYLLEGEVPERDPECAAA